MRRFLKQLGNVGPLLLGLAWAIPLEAQAQPAFAGDSSPTAKPAARPQSAQPASGRPLLLFEIDEGFSNSLVAAYRDDLAGLDARLERIYQGLAPLSSRYEVAVLIYPTYLYRRAGWSSGDDRPGLRFHPALRRVLSFFRQHRAPASIGVFLEAYSSGAATQQSGELGRQVPPTLSGTTVTVQVVGRASRLPGGRLAPALSPDNAGETPGAAGETPAPLPEQLRTTNDTPRLGLTADLSAFNELRKDYPDIFKGLRFHEIYGSDLVWKTTQAKLRHGFPLDPEVVRGCVALCASTGMRLLWSDSCWLMKCPPTTGEPTFVYNEAYPPYFMAEPGRTLQDDAERQLGGRLCFSWANNNYHPAQNLEYLDASVGASRTGSARPLPNWLYWRMPFDHFPLRGRPTALWGLSIQSWFWFELVNTLHGHYLPAGEMDCPEEVLGTYVLKGLREGAAILQFEPSWYFFNEQAPYAKLRQTLCRGEPEYAARPALTRLVQILLHPDAPGAPPGRLESLYDRDQQRLLENDPLRPPRTYAETTLLLALSPARTSEPPAVVCFDFTSSGARWRERTVERVPAPMLSGISQVCRADLAGSGVDGIAGITHDGRLAMFTDCGALQGEQVIGQPTTEGLVVGLCSANLVQEVVDQDDPDEVVVLRQVPGRTEVSFCLYGRDASPRAAWHYCETNCARLRASFAAINTNYAFLGIVGLRTKAWRFADGTRPLDRLVLLQARSGDEVVARVLAGNSPLCLLPGLSANAPGLAFTALDAQLEGCDQLCAVWREGARWQARIYRLEPGTAQPVGPARFVASARDGQLARPFSLGRRILLSARQEHQAAITNDN